MEIIKIRAKYAKEIGEALIAELTKGIPEEDRKGIREMFETWSKINSRADDAQAIPLKLVEDFNRLCYKLFPERQDGEEFEKVEPEKPQEQPTKGTAFRAIYPPRDEMARDIVHNYIINHLDKSDQKPASFDTYVVWKCKTLQNWKWLLASTLPDSMYYELTYNGDKHEYYLDAYRKVQNAVVPEVDGL